ncbi:uncharacterized protein BDV14DRAFT_22393 [Aspergillus stella-maris]|uniref:uncharacterized protein n=1 Tax=Aspergillus stella-maris TaxID=1810926 RepID=UPI003CCE294A
MDNIPARALVRHIAKQHGHLGEDVLSRMDPDVRREVEEAMLKKDAMIGSSVITLAKNLYNSTARFVFELLQNADDNSFSVANSTSTDPFVSFHVYDRRIVVECNEDGFTQDNLVAICNVGKSSKTGAQGYIGEKGIGFKSVFMVACKVHIQSRDFSFSFRHRKGESGMGMISPIWEDSDEVLPTPLTRITLFLHETGSDEALVRQRDTVLQQFQELSPTFLLFMKNIRRIEVKIYDDTNNASSHSTFSIQNKGLGKVALHHNFSDCSTTEDSTRYFHMTRYVASGIPRSENREYTEAEVTTQAFARPTIILAFPLTQVSMPIIESQDVFAFLPIRNMGLPFLVQADFVTDASRQDIVRSSARNAKLIRAVALAFVTAVIQLSSHPTLSYQWMRYLPDIQWSSQDSLWKVLPSEIRRLLQFNPTMWTRDHQTLRLIGDMRLVPTTMTDSSGEPLLPDLSPEQYPSPRYTKKDLQSLQAYGLRWLDDRGFIDRLQRDLDRGMSGVMQNPKTEADWHSQTANVLFKIGSSSLQNLKALQNLPLIKVRGDPGWICHYPNRHHPMYFSQVCGYSIPMVPAYWVIEPSAERNIARRKLFALLGVNEPSAIVIRRYLRENPAHNLEASVSHLQFLYLTAHVDGLSNTSADYSWVKLYNIASEKKSSAGGVWYFASEDAYSPHQLLANFDSGVNTKLKPWFLHQSYLLNCPETPDKEWQTWKGWLKINLLIRDTVRLCRGGNLSQELLYIAKSLPERFISFLQIYWSTDGNYIASSPELKKKLGDLDVLCEDGSRYPLAQTYLRTDQVQYANEFLRDNESFPWLKIDDSLSQRAGISDIAVVMKALGFGYPQSELHCYLTLLQYVARANRWTDKLEDPDRVFRLYSRIETRYQESVTPKISRDMIVSAFQSYPMIYVPVHGAFEHHSWASIDICLWEAPNHMDCFYPLKARYDAVGKKKHLRELFHDTLSIRNANVDDLMNELSAITDEDCRDWGEIYDLYREIDKKRPTLNHETANKIREKFETETLICDEPAGDKPRWYKSSECLWSSPTEIKGMLTLDDKYEELPEFFIELLGVRTLSLQMVHDKLVEQGKGQASVEEVKETVWLLNSYFQHETNLPSPQQVLEAKVFPVRYPTGGTQLCSDAANFAIPDRKHLSDLFSGKAKFLDFSTNEIARLEPFITWAGQEKRYLSNVVKEISTVRGESHRSSNSPGLNIARKAHGLLRIGVHFRSPRLANGEQHLFEILKKINVCETDGISSELHLNQDGKDIVVELSHSELHLQDSESGLIIYVPRDQQAQYLCFLDRIPRDLLQWIMTEPSTGICEPYNEKALTAISMVMQAEPKYIALALDRFGIMSVETPDDTAVDDIDSVSIALIEALEGQEGTQHQARESEVAERRHSSPRSESSVTLAGDDFISVSYGRSSIGPRLSSHPQLNPIVTPELEGFTDLNHAPPIAVGPSYLTLLRTVVNIARISPLPDPEVFPMAAANAALHTAGEPFQLRGVDKLTRDKLIGAAGELFVFELLSQLDPALPGFSRMNWQSTIRRLVNVHPDYRDLEPWDGRETADITYSDTEGVLTSLLMEKGYLDNRYAGGIPRYYIEVKSTTSSWDTPFYMSNAQYERMKHMSRLNADLVPPTEVYMICRVYNLGLEPMGMKIFMDPYVMEGTGELRFTADTWTVTPMLTVT